MKLERPFNYTQQEGAKFEVHFEKTRSFAGDAAEPVGLSHLFEGGISHWEQFVVGNEKAREVTELLLEGLTQKDVAVQLGISQGEVSKRKAIAASKGLL